MTELSIQQNAREVVSRRTAPGTGRNERRPRRGRRRDFVRGPRKMWAESLERREVLDGAAWSVSGSLQYAGEADTWLQAVPDKLEVEANSGGVALAVMSNDLYAQSARISSVQQISDWSGSTGDGKLSIGADGRTIWYVPRADYRGIDSFSYTILDAQTQQASRAMVVVTVASRYEAYNDYFGSIPSTSRDVQLDVLANDQHLSTEVPVILEVSQPEAGAVRTDGKFVYFTGSPEYLGGTSFQYRVRDSQGVIHDGQVTVQTSRAILAVDDYQRVDPGSDWGSVEVLGNDFWLTLGGVPYAGSQGTTGSVASPRWSLEVLAKLGAKIDSVSVPSGGGAARISGDGLKIEYRPAAGFRGVDSLKYGVTLPDGTRDEGLVKLEVAAPFTDSAGRPVYSPLELQQVAIEESARRFAYQFGVHYQQSAWSPIFWRDSSGVVNILSPTDTVGPQAENTVDYSNTNVQVAGVDEADLVKTDGRYLYRASGREVVVVDTADPSLMKIVSRIELDGYSQSIYLTEGRLVVLESSAYDNWRFAPEHALAERPRVLVFDVSNPAEPRELAEIGYSGQLTGSRLVGGRLYLMSDQWLNLPELNSTCDDSGDCVYEDADAYWQRLRDGGVQQMLPEYAVQLAGGEEQSQVAEAIYKSSSARGFQSFSSLAVIDVAGAKPSILGSVSVDTGGWNVVNYVTPEHYYLLRLDSSWIPNTNGWSQSTEILRFDIDAQTGKVALGATGKVSGRVLNQFSVDEYQGYLRVATTVDQWSSPSTNHIYVLQEQAGRLNVVGHVGNLALNESIFSARFMGDRAFLVTFRRIDPLFAIDLSVPEEPRVAGELKIPGFSNYLHPVGRDYLVGIGRDADPTNGSIQQPIITLFNVSNLSRPVEVDRDVITRLNWASSEALWDHHAVSFFDQHGILTLPLQGYLPNDGTGAAGAYINQLKVYRVDPTAKEAENSLMLLGNVEQDSASRRGVRIEEVLFAVADQQVTATDLLKPDDVKGTIYTGQMAVDDWADMSVAGASVVIPVLKNDSSPVAGTNLKLLGVTASRAGGVVTLLDDGTVKYVPPQGFTGADQFYYSVSHPVGGLDRGTVTVQVHALPDAVDDAYTLPRGAEKTVLNVLSNDRGEFGWDYPILYRTADGGPVATADALDSQGVSADFMRPGIWMPIYNNLKIQQVTSAGHGQVSISDDGRLLLYVPADGFQGLDSFDYTVVDPWGGTDRATVKIYVGQDAVGVVDVTANDGGVAIDRLQSIRVKFSRDISHLLTSRALKLVEGRSGRAVDLSAASMTWNGQQLTAEWDLTGLNVGVGQYELRLDGESLGQVLDGNGDGQIGDTLTENLTVVHPGDFDFDSDVDSSDLLDLVSSYTGALEDPMPGMSLTSGDLDGDGDVDSADVLDFLSRWTGSLAAESTDAAFV